MVRPNAVAGKSRNEIELNGGDSATVGRQDTVVRHATAESQTVANAIGFVRNIPKRVVKCVNLVDVVAGGDGFGMARDRGIDPTTGEIRDKQAEAGKATLQGDGRYHKVVERPFVDGVFIPRGGNEPVQLDSVGHTFTGFPKTDNCTTSPKWSAMSATEIGGHPAVAK